MQRGTAATGARFELVDLPNGKLSRYHGGRLTDYDEPGGSGLNLHWSRGEAGAFHLRGTELKLRPGGVVALLPDDDYRTRKSPSPFIQVVHLNLNLDAALSSRIHDPESPLAIQMARLFRVDAEGMVEAVDAIERWVGAESGLNRPRETQCVTAARLAADIMRAELAAPHRLDQLAADVGLSVNHLIRSFRHAEGLSPHVWLKEQRLTRACALLRQGRTVSEAAIESGWQSPASFSLAFARRFGVPPSQWVILNKSAS